MPGKTLFTIQDYGGEKTTTTIYTPTLSAANFDAVAGPGGDIEDLRTAIQGLILGNINKETIFAKETEVELGAASSPVAQRELKWLITYSDNVTGQEYQFELGTPDITNSALFTNSPAKEAILTAPAWVAFKTAFEAVG